jgi:hypothetical protein
VTTTTSTSTPSATPTITATQIITGLRLALSADTEQVIPGDKLYLYWEASGLVEGETGDLTLTLPQGLSPVKDEGGEYDPISGTLDIKDAAVAGKIKLEASTEDVGGEYRLKAEFHRKDGSVLPAELALKEHGRSSTRPSMGAACRATGLAGRAAAGRSACLAGSCT